MSKTTDNNINVRLIEKINQVEEKYNKNFSNTQKILMTTDGSITAILDVLYGKIDLKTLEQHFEEATEESAELVNVDVGDEVNYREIIMHKDDQPDPAKVPQHGTLDYEGYSGHQCLPQLGSGIHQ